MLDPCTSTTSPLSYPVQRNREWAKASQLKYSTIPALEKSIEEAAAGAGDEGEVCVSALSSVCSSACCQCVYVTDLQNPAGADRCSGIDSSGYSALC